MHFGILSVGSHASSEKEGTYTRHFLILIVQLALFPTWTIRMADARLRTVGLLNIYFEKSFSVPKLIGYGGFVAGKGEQDASEISKWRLENKEQLM